MLLLLSPAKSLDFETPPVRPDFTLPDFLDRSRRLIDILREKTPADLARLMDISDTLAVLNAGRYQDWSTPFTPANAKQAVLAFAGDVYDGLDAGRLDGAGLDWVQRHVRILSGLYGLLRPLDLIQPYRLEMGTRLPNPAGKDLYAFWRETLTQALARQLETGGASAVVNCASEEYAGAVDFRRLGARVIRPVFKDWKNGQYKIISFYAKKARGRFARYAATHAVRDADALRDFDLDGYRFDAAASTGDTWVFLRREAA